MVSRTSALLAILIDCFPINRSLVLGRIRSTQGVWRKYSRSSLRINALLGDQIAPVVDPVDWKFHYLWFLSGTTNTVAVALRVISTHAVHD